MINEDNIELREVVFSSYVDEEFRITEHMAANINDYIDIGWQMAEGRNDRQATSDVECYSDEGRLNLGKSAIIDFKTMAPNDAGLYDLLNIEINERNNSGDLLRCFELKDHSAAIDGKTLVVANSEFITVFTQFKRQVSLSSLFVFDLKAFAMACRITIEDPNLMKLSVVKVCEDRTLIAVRYVDDHGIIRQFIDRYDIDTGSLLKFFVVARHIDFAFGSVIVGDHLFHLAFKSMVKLDLGGLYPVEGATIGTKVLPKKSLKLKVELKGRGRVIKTGKHVLAASIESNPSGKCRQTCAVVMALIHGRSFKLKQSCKFDLPYGRVTPIASKCLQVFNLGNAEFFAVGSRPGALILATVIKDKIVMCGKIDFDMNYYRISRFLPATPVAWNRAIIRVVAGDNRSAYRRFEGDLTIRTWPKTKSSN